LKLTRKNY